MSGRRARPLAVRAPSAAPQFNGPADVVGLRVATASPAAAAYWQSMLEALPHAAWVAELRSRRLVAVNAAAVRLYERPASALLQEHADVLLASPEDQAWWQTAAEVVAAGAPQQALDALYSDTVIGIPDGRILHVARSIRGLAGGPADDSVTHALVMLIDGSAQQRAQLEREKLLADLQATLEATADGILVTDLGGRIRVFNQRFATLWSLPMEMLQQRDHDAVQDWMRRRVAGDEAARQSYQHRWQMINDAVELTDSARIELEGGGVLERVTRPLFQAGSVHGRVWSFRDLTEQLAARQQIDNLSRQDTLTGLPNRRVLAEQVVELLALRGARGGSPEGFALLMVTWTALLRSTTASVRPPEIVCCARWRSALVSACVRTTCSPDSAATNLQFSSGPPMQKVQRQRRGASCAWWQNLTRWTATPSR